MVSGISSNSSISQLFAKLDSKSQGYIEKSDLVFAFSQISTSTDSTEAEGVFAALDSDSDGKVTESELSTTLSKLQDELDSQFDSMRMDGFSGAQGAGGMADTPPPPKNDSGFTKDELSNQLKEIGSTDSQRSSLISNIVTNFAAADTDSDGKVSFAEAQAYDSKSKASSTTSDSTSSTASSDSKLMMKIMQLMHAYGTTGQDEQNSSISSQLSVSA